MSHTKVKTTYSVQGQYGSTETLELYCDHNHGNDSIIFYDKDGDYQQMFFNEWETGNDLYDAMERLYFPYVDKWYGVLKDNVELYIKGPWENDKK